jgi:hypothetical protein
LEFWLEKAVEYLPELEDLITREQLLPGPTSLWTDLYSELVAAYDVSPINEDRIRRIYDFAVWCLAQPNTADIETDVSSATAVAFIENLPLDQRISKDLHRWMSLGTFQGLESVFRCHLSEEEYRQYSKDFASRKKP